MLLVIDVGNSNIVLGVYEEGKMLYDWRIATAKDRSSDEYGMLFEQILNYHGLKINELDDVIISSVVPTLMHTLSSMCNRYIGIDPIIIGPGVKTGMNIKYDNPSDVGADRIVNSVAAYEKYGGPTVVVDFGTAITFDVINKKGEYLGGSICPGIQIAADALFTRTARLPKIEIKMPKSIIGKSTVESMQSGLVYGYIGLVDETVRQIMEEFEDECVKVVATGGFSTLISLESKYINNIDRFLTLDGLNIIYERNRGR